MTDNGESLTVLPSRFLNLAEPVWENLTMYRPELEVSAVAADGAGWVVSPRTLPDRSSTEATETRDFRTPMVRPGWVVYAKERVGEVP